MRFTVGEHTGRSVETVVLKEPDYVMWMLNKDVQGPLAYIKNEVRRLIEIFDSKPFTCPCRCGKTATRFSLAPPSPLLYWWCDECDPYSSGYDKLLTVGQAYREAMVYAKLHHLPKDQTKGLIRRLAEAKGLPKRVTEEQAEEFFNEV
jgi:hypothetical protein